MTAVIFNVPESMTMVRVVTLKDYSEPTLKVLHRTGVLHVEEGKELKPVDRAAIERQQKEVDELRSFVSRMMSYIEEKEQVSLGEDVEVVRVFGKLKVKHVYVELEDLVEYVAEAPADMHAYRDPD